tara:strand:- start:4652 stop:5014 length:363 start_codon:yes stop_codon:yes gene_type:complete
MEYNSNNYQYVFDLDNKVKYRLGSNKAKQLLANYLVELNSTPTIQKGGKFNISNMLSLDTLKTGVHSIFGTFNDVNTLQSFNQQSPLQEQAIQHLIQGVEAETCLTPLDLQNQTIRASSL